MEKWKEKNGITPVLLLDDIFDKLDNRRVAHLMKMVAEQHFGQIFITDTSRDRVESILNPCNIRYSLHEVENGSIA